MPNDLDQLLSTTKDSSTALKSFSDQNGVSKDQLLADGDAATAQQAMQLIDQEMRELMQDDPSSTVGQPGDASTQKFIYAPPRNVIVMPKIHWNKPACYSDSWWTRQIAPTPKSEMDFTHLVRKKLPPPGISEKDLKYPPSIKNFPITFDRMLGYREFLS